MTGKKYYANQNGKFVYRRKRFTGELPVPLWEVMLAYYKITFSFVRDGHIPRKKEK